MNHLFLLNTEALPQSSPETSDVSVGASDTDLQAAVEYGKHPTDALKPDVVVEASSDGGSTWTTLATLTSASPTSSGINVTSYQSGDLRARVVGVDAPVHREISIGLSLT